MNKIQIYFFNEPIKTGEYGNFLRGKIQINDFWDIFNSSIDSWSKQEYEQQWKEGLERLKTHNKSCLVATAEIFKALPSIDWWLLYKENNKIFIRNSLLIAEYYEETIGDKKFTIDTCYDFIEPRDDGILENGRKCSEWVVDL